MSAIRKAHGSPSAGRPPAGLEWRLDPSSEHHIAEACDYDLRIAIVCNEGYQSSLAAAQLRSIGLRRATDLIGGFQAWLAFTTGGTR